MKPSESQLSFSIIDTKMTVAAMRSSGYRSTTHALAELIDNSIEAGATAIEVFGISGQDENSETDNTKGACRLRQWFGNGRDYTSRKPALWTWYS